MECLSRGASHVGLRPQCGICGNLMEVTERFHLLLGNDDSTTFSQCLGPYIFPGYGHRLQHKSGVSLCRKPNCGLCVISPEASTVHSDCFEFIGQCCKLDDYMDYLWVLTAWRTPWRRAPHFCLEETVVKLDWSVFDDFDIFNMRFLPPEILEMIRRYSAMSIIWRFNAVSNLARQLPVTLSDHVLSIPLCEVAIWKRSDRPVMTEIGHQLPVMRLTIDSWGIREVETLAGNPQFARWRADDLVFVILDQKRLKDVIAHFKFGLLRLELPETWHGLQTWDTPTPPDLDRCSFYPADITYSTRFQTIELQKTSGITFLFSWGEIHAVHAHTEATPCAQTTYQRLSRRRQRAVTWFYIPFSQNDCITAFGSQMLPAEGTPFARTCLLFRMKLGGDVPIGLTSSKQARDLLLSKSTPMTIIFNTRELRPVSVVGAYSIEEKDSPPMKGFRHPIMFDDPPFSNACFSLAPLGNVNRVSVFNNEQTGWCMGILLHYQNGAQRSLGQCRVGIDPVEEYVNPIRICYRRQVHVRSRSDVELEATSVKCTSKKEHDHDEEGWACFEMQGELEFWFNCEETELTAIVD